VRILLINSEFPYPPRAANSLIPYQLLMQWKGKHRISLYCLALESPKVEDKQRIEELCSEVRIFPHKFDNSSWARIRHIFSARPHGVSMFANQHLLDAVLVDANTANFDVLVALCINTAQYAIPVVDSLPTVVTPLDAVSLLYSRRLAKEHSPIKRFYLGWQQRRIARYERESYCLLGAAVMVSAKDREVIAGECPQLPIFVAPLGVEVNPGALPRPPAQFVMTANFGYAPNHNAALWLLQEIWGMIRRELPRAQLRLAGRGMDDEIRSYDDRNGVEIAGEVPSIRDELAAATVALNPMRFGSGMRLKALEAFAAGTPLVSTRLGVEGLPVRDGKEVLLADDAMGFAQAAVRIAGDLSLQQRLREGGLALVVKGYSWENYARVVEEAMAEAIKGFKKQV
jgi:glycosyltransferase involved in cell wall biosynthesis